MRLAGHCVRHKEEPTSNLVFMGTNGGRRKRNYIDNLQDTGINNFKHLENLENLEQ